MSQPLTGLMPNEIAELLSLKPFQGAQIFRWLHQRQVFDFDAMTDLSKAVRAQLHECCTPSVLEPAADSRSERSGTRKLLFRLPDNETVEAVLIRDRDRTTLCLSSQVGCPLKCAFCATGAAGYTRNLEPAEIVEQALHLLRDEELEGRTPNIVFMGMGEPLRNYDNVMKAIHLLMASNGLGIGARKITISTVGEVGGIERFAHEDWQVRLSVSLHAANDELRSRLVPLNKRYPLRRLHQALEDYQARTQRQMTFEWTLLEGVNDREQDAVELLRYSQGLQVSVNLIPWNPVPDLPFEPSSANRCRWFRDYLDAQGLRATLRQEKGRDIDAACGQLRRIHAG